MPDDPFDRLRAICLSFPEATEKITWDSTPTFRVRDKIFVLCGTSQHDDGHSAFWCKAPSGVQEILVGSDPERFFVPPYVGHHGWIGVRLDSDLDWEEIGDLVDESYRMTAPKRLIASLNRDM